MKLLRACIAAIAVALITPPASAADYPTPKEGNFVARDFRFHTGEVMPEIRLHYRTVGESTGQPVLILHGTAGSGANMLNQAFAGELFGAGQPLDATKHFIILPDALGTGKSSKPSDGLRTKFPKYNYDDMVLAQYRLLTEGLGIRHLRLVIGNSMGGMQTWLWGTTYPTFMDPAAARSPTRSSHRRASAPTNSSTSVWRRRPLPMRTTCFSSGTLRATIIRRPSSTASSPRSWPSIQRTMSAIRLKPGCWSARSSASRMAAST
jgi:homoserine O-acetyltransferase